MSRRRQVIQLEESSRSTPTRTLVPPVQQQQQYSDNDDDDDDDDDGMGDMPTPERLVPPELMPNGGGLDQGRFRMDNSLDNKVADFLAEIDALEPGADEDLAHSPVAMRYMDRDDDSPPRDKYSPPPGRKYSPARDSGIDRGKAGAYSNMFVKGTPEFVKKPDEQHTEKATKILEPWPEEPRTDWEQLTDEKTNYPYYWNTVTNEVVWDMPSDFSAYLLLQKEYQEKVERGLREGTLDPKQRGKPREKLATGSEKRAEPSDDEDSRAQKSERPERSSRVDRVGHSRPDRHSSDSSDSSSDGSDSDRSVSRDRKEPAPQEERSQQEVPSSSTSSIRDSSRDADKGKVEAVLPDSTERIDKGVEKEPPAPDLGQEDSMDFDIDDIDKELERALERKRQELMDMEKKKEEKPEDKSKGKEKEKDRKKDDQKHRETDRRDDRHRHDDDRRKHSKHREKDHDKEHDRGRDKERDRDRDRDKGRDRDRDRKHHKESEKEKEDKKPKLTLKERLRIEMELKMEKERRKKKAIEDLMARELENTVGSSKGRKRHREEDDEPRKRYRDEGIRHSRDEYDEYRREYDDYDRLPSSNSNDRTNPPQSMKPPPPTAEMIAYEEARRSQVVDYGHGRSKHDSDIEESKSADLREIEMKKLEALQLAELALSKLEFLEVTKKGLSKLQILLIELETRHQDWQAGGLTTNHFLGKLREANWQLEQYEESAAPTGWVCSWDRDYRRYFYTHQLTGKTQWDYPDATDIRTEDEKAAREKKGKVAMETDMEISSTSDREKDYKSKEDLTSEILASAASLPPPPPPPAEEHPSVKSLQLMYGSSSDSEEEEVKSKKKPKKEREDTPPLPPVPPQDKHHSDKDRREDRHSERDKKDDKHGDKEKKDKHKSKKKKKEKSKKKDKDKPDSADTATAVGPQLPLLPQVGPDQQAVQQVVAPEGPWFPQQPLPPGVEEEVPVYSSTETSGQNDQPLEFGQAQIEVSHPPETYSASPSAYPDPYATTAGDGTQSGITEATEAGSTSDLTAAAANVSAEEKKKKKKEKMGGANISLKKKHVSSMVQKWQKVKKEVELEERDRAIREAEIRRKLAELE